jgi:hypothetical protein
MVEARRRLIDAAVRSGRENLRPNGVMVFAGAER